MATNNQRGRANLLIGMMLVGLGALFLIGQVFNVNLWQFLWPFFIIVPGLLFFVGMLLGGKPAGPLAIPGSIVMMVGLLLLYQAVTNHWESWAYAWALIFPTSVGIGLAINGAWSDVERLTKTGMRWITAGLIIFLVGGVFFEVLLNISRGIVSDVVWPGLLIVLGVYLLVRRGSRSNEPAVREPEEPATGEPTPEAEATFEPIGASQHEGPQE
jgi:hypothetical protein